MIVEPGLLNHPKFKAFRKKVGPAALEYLVRLWEHCQLVKKSGNWGPVGPEYVEEVAGWGGEPGKLWSALTHSVVTGGSGWCHCDAAGNVIIHAWEEYNSTLLAAWKNGRKGGRPKVFGDGHLNGFGQSTHKTAGFPSGSRPVTTGQPAGNPSGTDRQTDRIDRIEEKEVRTPDSVSSEDLTNGEARIPTPEEMILKLPTAGITLESARRFHAYMTKHDCWTTVDWRKRLVRWAAEDRERLEARKQGRAAMANSKSREELEAELRDLEAEIQNLTPESSNRKAVGDRYREVKELLRSGVR